MLDKDGIALLSKLCEMTEGEKYSVYDWTDVFDGGLDDERKNVWRTLLQQGCVSVKYSDESSVCFAVTLKGRNINEELATMQVVGDENQTVVRTDAAGRPVMVVKDGQSFVDNLRKKTSQPLARVYLGYNRRRDRRHNRRRHSRAYHALCNTLI